MKLLLAPLNVTYQELFSLIVWDINNKECMVHRCLNCPKSNTLLQDFLFHTIGDFDGDDDDDDDDIIELTNGPILIEPTLLAIQKLLMSMLILQQSNYIS